MNFRIALCAAAMAAASPAFAHPQDVALNDVYGRLAAARTAHDLAGMAATFPAQALLIDARPGSAVSGAELPAVLAPQRDRLVKDGVSVSSAYRIERRQVIGADLALDAGYMRQALSLPGAPEQIRYARFLVTLSARRKAGGSSATPPCHRRPRSGPG